MLSREFLLDRVWALRAADEIESRTVDVHVRRLRVKLAEEGRRILTVKSVGYRFDPDAGDRPAVSSPPRRSPNRRSSSP